MHTPPRDNRSQNSVNGFITSPFFLNVGRPLCLSRPLSLSSNVFATIIMCVCVLFYFASLSSSLFHSKLTVTEFCEWFPNNNNKKKTPHKKTPGVCLFFSFFFFYFIGKKKGLYQRSELYYMCRLVKKNKTRKKKNKTHSRYGFFFFFLVDRPLSEGFYKKKKSR